MNKGNFIKGILGGFLGSIVGVIAIIIFYKLGYVAALAGLIMAVCTIKLYQKFAGGIDKKGIIACIIIMIIMTLVGYNLAISIVIADELKSYSIDSDISYIFFNLYSLIDEGLVISSAYVRDLIMIIAFNLIGAVGVFKKQLQTINGNTANPVNGVVNNQIYSNNVNTLNNMNTNYGNINNANLNNVNNNFVPNPNQVNNNINQINSNNVNMPNNMNPNFGNINNVNNNFMTNQSQINNNINQNNNSNNVM